MADPAVSEDGRLAKYCQFSHKNQKKITADGQDSRRLKRRDIRNFQFDLRPSAVKNPNLTVLGVSPVV